MNKWVSIYEAKAKLSSLVREVQETKGTVTISKHGKPTVDIVPHLEKKEPLTLLPALKGAKYMDDPCLPTPREDWPEELR